MGDGRSIPLLCFVSAIATFSSCVCFISLCIFPVFAARLLFCSAFASVSHHMEPQLGSHSGRTTTPFRPQNPAFSNLFFLHIIKFTGVCCHYFLGLMDGGQVLFKIRSFSSVIGVWVMNKSSNITYKLSSKLCGQ